MNNWQWAMKKPQVPLAQGLHVISIPLMKKNLDYKGNLHIKHVDGDIYFCKQCLDNLYKHIKQKINNDPFFPDKIKQKIDFTVKKLQNTVEKLRQISPKTLSNTELITNFFKAYQVIAELTAFMSFKGTVQISQILEKKFRTLLSKKTQDKDQQDNLFLQFSMPIQDSLMFQEQNSIIRIAQSSNQEQLLKQHAEKFSWMGCVMFTGLPYTIEHYKKQLKKVKPLKKTKQTIPNLNFTEKEELLLKQFREWIHLRTYIKDMTSIGMRPTLKFLKEIAKRLNTEYNNLLHLSNEELKQIFTNNQIKESKKRQKSWGFTYINQKPTYYNHENIHLIKESEQTLPSGIKGFPACKGQVTGKAIIVKTMQDIENIQDGHILITHMTTTNFVPYLSKVSAIITDEGGITCHAAIISRELNIPCIIGTRLATKAFKDNDLLEVNANIGTIKKL